MFNMAMARPLSLRYLKPEISQKFTSDHSLNYSFALENLNRIGNYLKMPNGTTPMSSTNFITSRGMHFNANQKQNLTQKFFRESLSSEFVKGQPSLTRLTHFQKCLRPFSISESSKSHFTINASASNSQSSNHNSNDNPVYRNPSDEILKIVDAEPTPSLSFSPKRDKILFLHRPSLPPVAELARPELKLAGLRIDPECNTRSRMSFYSSISIRNFNKDYSLGEEMFLKNLPEGCQINFLSWSPDGRHLAFSVRTKDEEDVKSLLSLWIADAETGEARELVSSDEYPLNTVFDSYGWINESSLIVFTIPQGRTQPPKKPRIPMGPKIQSNESGQVSQARTYQDLLKDAHDEDIFEYYATSQLLVVDLNGSVRPIGEPKMYTAAEPSHDGKYLLVASMERPFSYLVPCGRFPKRIQVWDLVGNVMQEVAYLPLAESIPIAFNSVREGRRSIGWRCDLPSTLSWVETQDGGDAKVEVSPRDIVYSFPANPSDNENPEIICQLDYRYGGISWGDEHMAFVYESWHKTRQTRTWQISPSDTSAAPKLIFERSYEDVYSDPGSPMQRRTKYGTYVLAKFVTDDGRIKLILNGYGATPDGNVPFLDLFDLETLEKERIWESDKEKHFESIVSLISDTEVDENPQPLNKLCVIISRESQQEPPQYHILKWSDKSLVQLTHFPHPYPSLQGLSKEIIRYDRSDGVQLTANLYLPPGYEQERDGPLPMLVWAYPREYKSKDSAGQVRGSNNQFPGIGSSSPLLWLAMGYAVLNGPSMPIIGEGDDESNDRFIEQLVMSAKAAVDEVVRRKVADPKRIAIGGHSYGAFMAANLLAHSDLFCCAIAQSGAYNRTFTPFGFQSEERTIWEVPEVYMKMSPFMNAHKVKKPILLIHGEEDSNPGTFPMQSERFFAALKGHGVSSKLVLLPYESHGYRARESILHALAEVGDWLNAYCPLAPFPDEGEEGEKKEEMNKEEKKEVVSSSSRAGVASAFSSETDPSVMNSQIRNGRSRLMENGKPRSAL